MKAPKLKTPTLKAPNLKRIKKPNLNIGTIEAPKRKPKAASSRKRGGPDPDQSAEARDLLIARERLLERFTIMQADLGGAFYEMAIRDHVKLDVLTRKAAELQRVDVELGEIEEHLKLISEELPQACSNCGEEAKPGDAFCSSCGNALGPASKNGATNGAAKAKVKAAVKKAAKK